LHQQHRRQQERGARSDGPPDLIGRVAIATLGCKVNNHESNAIAQGFRDAHWSVVNASEVADVYVINSCTVTAEADRQSRQQVRRLARHNPRAKIVITGCYAQMQPETCGEISGVDLVVGNANKFNIPALATQLLEGRVSVGSEEELKRPTPLLYGYETRTRASVQIQQGCDQACTFCVIHTARGLSRSFPQEDIVKQVRHWVTSGYKEVVICGVDLGDYGTDLSPQPAPGPLEQLLAELSALEGDFRIRLSSIDPIHLSDALLEFVGQSDRFCPYLHLSLQSGNTMILKRMKRRYTSEWVDERVAIARRLMPGLVLGADVMVGFPTETEEQFADTLQAIESLEICYPHVFPYSARDGTPAARIPRQVDPTTRKRRGALARTLGQRIRERVFARHLGSVASVLVERSVRPDRYNARLTNYLPVRVEVGERMVGKRLPVRIVGTKPDYLIGEPHAAGIP
jgi:threonylcarbamoyladenosine tRNA methylthiotransferase MtaB